jgi:hypothetical protein
VRRACGILVLDTIIYSAIFSVVIYLASAKNSFGDYLSTVIYVSRVFGIYRFRVYYQSNIELHSELLSKLGDDYKNTVLGELKNSSLRKMIYETWFKKQGEAVWPGKLD